MPDRSAFWSPVPGWVGAVLEAEGLRVCAREPVFAWQLSGDSAEILVRHGVTRALGPRDRCAGERYALRLAPDSVLLVCDGALDIGTGWSGENLAISDLADAIVFIDIEGPRAAELMALGCEYPFGSLPDAAQESARLLFAGLRLAVMRRPHGWRLHVERPWAAALWHWLAACVLAPPRG